MMSMTPWFLKAMSRKIHQMLPWILLAVMGALARPVFAQGEAPASASPLPEGPETEGQKAPSANRCTALSITTPQSAKTDIGAMLSRFETAIASADSHAFLGLLHPAIIKEPSEKRAIFQTMIEGYDLKGKTLQRRFLYELSLGGPSQKVRCLQHEVTAVVGPVDQWATEYSFTNNGEQARLFLLIGRIPKSLQRKVTSTGAQAPADVGIVHIHTQNWSFSRQTPESLFNAMRKWQVLSEPVAAWAFGTAARRIVRSNGYLFDTGFEASLADHDRLQPEFESKTSEHLNKPVPGSDLTIRDFTAVFRETELALGVKVTLEGSKELSVNEQIEQCRTLTRHLLPLVAGAHKAIPGIECMVYQQNEPRDGPPFGGTIFTAFKDAMKASPSPRR
jgi:hypothetical protein